jgi:hypothetical protein
MQKDTEKKQRNAQCINNNTQSLLVFYAVGADARLSGVPDDYCIAQSSPMFQDSNIKKHEVVSVLGQQTANDMVSSRDG